jgi:hypothetical protein
MSLYRVLLRGIHGDVLIEYVGDSGRRIRVGPGRRVAPARLHVDALHRGGHVAVAEGDVPHLLLIHTVRTYTYCVHACILGV